MKNHKLLIIAVITAIAMLTMTGCWGNDRNNSSVSSSVPSVSSLPPASSPASDTSSVPGDIDGDGVPETSGSVGDTSGNSGSSDISGSSNNSASVPEDPDLNEELRDNSGSSSSNSSSVATMGTDFEGIGALPSKSMDWGPGGPVDSQNRSQSSLSYNQKFGKYNAIFIGPEEKVVYMTFDEGYEHGLTGKILDTLKEKNVKATFFVTYDFAKQADELVRRMIDEGHVVGNHSYSHKNYSTLSPKQAADDLMKMHEYIKENFDYDMKYFRFPSGNFNEQTMAAVQAMGYRSLFWSFAYKDWLVDQQPEPAASCDKIVNAVCPGNIYLLHAVSDTNNQILGQVIDRIREAGYQWGDPSGL